MAVSRSMFSVRPLTCTLSIAGIMECTPSWGSLKHSLAIVTSLDSSQPLCQRLIAERELKAMETFVVVNGNDRVVTLQIEKFHILPLRILKASGKAFPMISGTATKLIVRNQKGRQIYNALKEVTDPFI